MVRSQIITRVDSVRRMKSNNQSRKPLDSGISFNRHKPRTRRTRDRAGKKQSLIVAALKLFASKGYEATTTREIAACAGCAEGLIHRYFEGKAGLIPALMEYRVSQEVADLTLHIPPAQSFEDEYLHLVSWAVEHIWEDREFLRVAIPRAMLDPDFGQLLRQVGPLQRARAVSVRLKKFRESRALSEAEFDALVQSVSVIGFMFGFMRPAVLRQDRRACTKTATSIARLMVRSFSPDTEGRPLRSHAALYLT